MILISLDNTRYLLIYFLLIISISYSSIADPYRTLEITRAATKSEISQAYRKLALQYHPDKNPTVSAREKFLKIKDAYDILSNPTKKKNYDKYGTIDPHEIARQQRYFSRSFNYYHGKNNYDDVSERITSENFKFLITSPSTVYSVSFWLLFVYGSRCHWCEVAKPIWSQAALKLVGDLKVLRSGTVSADYENSLLRRLGVRRIPAVVGISVDHNGNFQSTIFRQSAEQYTVKHILSFASSLIERFGRVSMNKVEEQLINKPKFQIILNSNRLRRRPPILLQRLAAEYSSETKVSYIYNSNYENSHIVVFREKDAPESIIENIPQNFKELNELIKPLLYWRLPEITVDNFFPLCYVQASEGFINTQVNHWKPSKTVQEQTFCLIYFAVSRQDALSSCKLLYDKNSPYNRDLQNGRLRLGWMSITKEKDFIRRLGNGKLVLLNTIQSKAYIFTGINGVEAIENTMTKLDRLLSGSLSMHRIPHIPFPQESAERWEWSFDLFDDLNLKGYSSKIASSLGQLLSSLGSILFVMIFLGGGLFL